jgi:hypothetical protein
MMKNKNIDERITALESAPKVIDKRLAEIRASLADEEYKRALLDYYVAVQLHTPNSRLDPVEVEERMNREWVKMCELITALEAVLDKLEMELTPELVRMFSNNDKRLIVRGFLGGPESYEWGEATEIMKEAAYA